MAFLVFLHSATPQQEGLASDDQPEWRLQKYLTRPRSQNGSHHSLAKPLFTNLIYWVSWSTKQTLKRRHQNKTHLKRRLNLESSASWDKDSVQALAFLLFNPSPNQFQFQFQKSIENIKLWKLHVKVVILVFTDPCGHSQSWSSYWCPIWCDTFFSK